MSETKTVREPCDHGRYERHQYQTPTFITKFWCEGGKEIVLRKVYFESYYEAWEIVDGDEDEVVEE